MKKDKRVMVTGGYGFLGKHVIRHLINEGYSNIFSPRKEDYDLMYEVAVGRLFENHPSEIVIHLAANAGGIGYNLKNPAKLFRDNILMNLHLLHEAYNHGVEKFVGIGSICSYPKYTKIPFKEEDLWNGYPEETNAAYGNSKRMLIVQSQAYKEQFGFNSINLLPVNLYGPEDRGFFEPERGHVIPDLIRKFFEAKESKKNNVVLFGDGSPTREFLYVEDCAEGIVAAMEKYDETAPINLGNGREISIRDLAETLKEKIDYKGDIIWDVDKPNGQPRRCLEVSKAKKLFGWEAKTDFDEGLEKTIQWYRSQKLV